MAAVHNNVDTLRSPPSPSLTNPDMILPYDPRLRDSVLTETTENSEGPDITSLNDQMAKSLGGTRIAKQVNIPARRPDKRLAPVGSNTQDATGQGNTFQPGTSFLNLTRYSTVSGLPPPQSEDIEEVPPVDKDDSEGELTARNDFVRAEQILANAKKRLTAMEGNLTRARSLSVSRSTSVASGVPEDRSSWRTSDGSAHANGWAISASKLRQANWNPTGTTSNHTRVFSENAVPNSPRTLLNDGVNGGNDPQRSTSAMGAFNGEASTVTGHHENHYRGGIGRLEPLREDEQLTPSPDHQSSSRTGLDRLQDLPAKARSNVQLRDLRDQMQDLKDKLSVLKKRTREDSLHRRSMQYLKSPSPFTDAEAWRNTPPRNGSRQSTRHSEDTPRPGDTPKTQNVPEETTPIPRPDVVAIAPGTINDDDVLGSPGTMVHGPRAVIEGALTSLDEKLANSPHASPQPRAVMHRPNLSGSLQLPPNLNTFEKSAFDPWSPHSEKAEILNVDDLDKSETGEGEGDGNNNDSREESDEVETKTPPPEDEILATSSTLSEDSEAEMSHEERPDAFDYENFVISSTMGTYERSTQRSRSSSSSTSTIGPEDYPDSTSPPLVPGAFTTAESGSQPYHTRHQSGGSETSLDTFATAQSRSGSRLQAESRQALREAASREMIADMPGAFVNSQAATPVPSADAFISQEAPASAHMRTDSYDSHASSEGTERPRSFPPASGSGRQSNIYTYSVASTIPSIFSSTNAAPVIDPATDPTAIAARTSILRTLLAHPLPAATGARNSEVTAISETDEALLRAVIEGLQRVCGKLAWSGALYGDGVGGHEVALVRHKLDAARVALEDMSDTMEEDEDEDEEDEAAEENDDTIIAPKHVDSWFGDGAEETYVAL